MSWTDEVLTPGQLQAQFDAQVEILGKWLASVIMNKEPGQPIGRFSRKNTPEDVKKMNVHHAHVRALTKGLTDKGWDLNVDLRRDEWMITERNT